MKLAYVDQGSVELKLCPGQVNLVKVRVRITCGWPCLKVDVLTVPLVRAVVYNPIGNVESACGRRILVPRKMEPMVT